MNPNKPEQARLSKKDRKMANRKLRLEEKNSKSSEIMGISRRSFLKTLLIGGGAVALGGLGISRLLEGSSFKSLPEQVRTFNHGSSSESEREALIRNVVTQYIAITGSTRINVEDMVKNRILFFNSYEEYGKAISRDCGGDSNKSAWTCFDSGKVYFNKTRLWENTRNRPDLQGLFLAALTVHEIGHVDLTPRASSLKDDPRYYFDFRDGSGRQSYDTYYGVQVYTKQRGFGFNNTEEVVVDTIQAWMLTEKLVPIASQALLTEAVRSSVYYQNGVEILLPYVRKLMPFQQFYNLHATSDFEGMAEALGRNLPGSNSAFERGRELMVGFQANDRARIERTGIFSLIR